jgi:hypothetical protein
VMGGRPVLNEDLVNLPNWLVLKLRIEGDDAITLGNVELLEQELQELFERLGYAYQLDTARKNIEYYDARTSHGSTLSLITHAAVLAPPSPPTPRAIAVRCALRWARRSMSYVRASSGPSLWLADAPRGARQRKEQQL